MSFHSIDLIEGHHPLDFREEPTAIAATTDYILVAVRCERHGRIHVFLPNSSQQLFCIETHFTVVDLAYVPLINGILSLEREESSANVMAFIYHDCFKQEETASVLPQQVDKCFGPTALSLPDPVTCMAVCPLTGRIALATGARIALYAWQHADGAASNATHAPWPPPVSALRLQHLASIHALASVTSMSLLGTFLAYATVHRDARLLDVQLHYDPGAAPVDLFLLSPGAQSGPNESCGDEGTRESDANSLASDDSDAVRERTPEPCLDLDPEAARALEIPPQGKVITKAAVDDAFFTEVSFGTDGNAVLPIDPHSLSELGDALAPQRIGLSTCHCAHNAPTTDTVHGVSCSAGVHLERVRLVVYRPHEEDAVHTVVVFTDESLKQRPAYLHKADTRFMLVAATQAVLYQAETGKILAEYAFPDATSTACVTPYFLLVATHQGHLLAYTLRRPEREVCPFLLPASARLADPAVSHIACSTPERELAVPSPLSPRPWLLFAHRSMLFGPRTLTLGKDCIALLCKFSMASFCQSSQSELFKSRVPLFADPQETEPLAHCAPNLGDDEEPGWNVYIFRLIDFIRLYEKTTEYCFEVVRPQCNTEEDEARFTRLLLERHHLVTTQLMISEQIARSRIEPSSLSEPLLPGGGSQAEGAGSERLPAESHDDDASNASSSVSPPSPRAGDDGEEEDEPRALGSLVTPECADYDSWQLVYAKSCRELGDHFLDKRDYALSARFYVTSDYPASEIYCALTVAQAEDGKNSDYRQKARRCGMVGAMTMSRPATKPSMPASDALILYLNCVLFCKQFRRAVNEPVLPSNSILSHYAAADPGWLAPLILYSNLRMYSREHASALLTQLAVDARSEDYRPTACGARQDSFARALLAVDLGLDDEAATLLGELPPNDLHALCLANSWLFDTAPRSSAAPQQEDAPLPDTTDSVLTPSSREGDPAVSFPQILFQNRPQSLLLVLRTLVVQDKLKPDESLAILHAPSGPLSRLPLHWVHLERFIESALASLVAKAWNDIQGACLTCHTPTPTVPLPPDLYDALCARLEPARPLATLLLELHIRHCLGEMLDKDLFPPQPRLRRPSFVAPKAMAELDPLDATFDQVVLPFRERCAWLGRLIALQRDDPVFGCPEPESVPSGLAGHALSLGSVSLSEESDSDSGDDEGQPGASAAQRSAARVSVWVRSLMHAQALLCGPFDLDRDAFLGSVEGNATLSLRVLLLLSAHRLPEAFDLVLSRFPSVALSIAKACCHQASDWSAFLAAVGRHRQEPLAREVLQFLATSLPLEDFLSLLDASLDAPSLLPLVERAFRHHDSAYITRLIIENAERFEREQGVQ